MSDEIQEELEMDQVVEESKEVSISQPQSVAVASETSETSALLRMAVENDFDADKLEKLIQLKNQEEERQAKKEFDIHFMALQKKLPAIKKGKAVYNNDGKLLYKFAPIELILNENVKSIIAEHGFSVFWDQKDLDKEIEISCVVAGWEHEKRTTMRSPVVAQSAGGINIIQQRGITITYLKRYTLCNALGIIIEDEDTDGVVDYEEAYKVELNNIREAYTSEMVVAIYRSIRDSVTDKDAFRYLEGAMREKKLQLDKVQNGTEK